MTREYEQIEYQQLPVAVLAPVEAPAVHAKAVARGAVRLYRLEMSDNPTDPGAESFDWSTGHEIDPSQVQDAVQGRETPAEIIARVEEQVRIEQAGAEES
jgi:hypothetical protein